MFRESRTILGISVILTLGNICHSDLDFCQLPTGPTIGFVMAVFLAIICWPLALFFCCCATDAGKK